MKGRALDLVLLPLFLVYGVTLAAAVLLLDLIALPFVMVARRRLPRDEPPPTRNASVIVLNWNGRHFLEGLLPGLEVAVRAASGDHEIIVVDNGSTDGSAEWVEASFPGVRLVRLPENRFFVRGNLEGVRAATKDILVFLNNDMRVEPAFLERLLARFGAADLFAVTARIVMEGKAVETGRTRSYFRRGAFRNEQVEGPPSDSVPAMWAGGGSSAFDARKFRELGGFEDLYHPFYVEDQSLSYQAWRRGWRVLFEPGSVVHHVHRGTSARVFGPKLVELVDRRNREIFFWRSVTDPRMVLAHALLLPWNALKDSRTVSLGLQARSLAMTVPRLGTALWLRERSRMRYRRKDREVLAVACHVGLHRRDMARGAREPLVVLSVGAGRAGGEAPSGVRVVQEVVEVPEADGPPPEDLHGLLPRRFWAARDGEARDRVRDFLAETDCDVVHLRDPLVAALALPYLGKIGCVLEPGTPSRGISWLERLREERLLRRLVQASTVVVCASDADGVWVRGRNPRARIRFLGEGGTGGLGEIYREALHMSIE